MQPYERFRAWQACHELALSVYRATGHWPTQERFGLVAQARRAAYSAAVNIAEGSAKRGSREFRRFLDVSLGSLAELSYVLRLARDIGILSHEEAFELAQAREEAAKLTWGLYNRIRSTI